ncbi:hypothetical protein D3C76_1056360 [compost metagenome]
MRDAFYFPAEANVYSRQAFGVPFEHWLDKHLLTSVQRLGGWPALVASMAAGQGVAPARPMQPSDLMRGVARVVGNVRRVIIGQSQGADLFGNAETAIVLHGARGGGVGFGEGGGGRVFFEKNARYSPPPQFQCQYQTRWATTNN